jgi:hypothetical protein
LCSYVPCDVTQIRGTPVQVSLSAVQCLKGKPPAAPRPTKQHRTSSVQHKVQPWLQKLTAAHSPDVASANKVLAVCSMSSVPSSFATESGVSFSDHSVSRSLVSLSGESRSSDNQPSCCDALPKDTIYQSHYQQNDFSLCPPELTFIGL